MGASERVAAAAAAREARVADMGEAPTLFCKRELWAGLRARRKAKKLLTNF